MNLSIDSLFSSMNEFYNILQNSYYDSLRSGIDECVGTNNCVNNPIRFGKSPNFHEKNCTSVSINTARSMNTTLDDYPRVGIYFEL